MPISGLRPGNLILGYYIPPGGGEIQAFQVSPQFFNTAVDALRELSISGPPQVPWTEEQRNQFEHTLQRGHLVPSNPSHIRAAELNAALHNIGEIVIDGLSQESFLKEARHNMAQLFNCLPVALVDLVGFSPRPMEAQVGLLKQMENLLDESLGRVSRFMTTSNRFPELCITSTGDGFYLFSPEEGLESAAAVFLVLADFMANARELRLSLRGAMVVDSSYTFYRKLGTVSRGNGGISNAVLDLIGPASNSLSRILAALHANQCVIAHNAASYCRALTHQPSPPGNLVLNPSRPSPTDKIERNAWTFANPFRDLLTDYSSGKILAQSDGRTWFFSPDKPLAIRGKHPHDLFYVWNIEVHFTFNGRSMRIGIPAEDVTPFSSVEFLQDDMLSGYK